MENCKLEDYEKILDIKQLVNKYTKTDNKISCLSCLFSRKEITSSYFPLVNNCTKGNNVNGTYVSLTESGDYGNMT